MNFHNYVIELNNTKILNKKKIENKIKLIEFLYSF